MAVFSADEVYQIAMEMEQTGQVFYEALAAGSARSDVAALCRRLAAQEVEHYNRFSRLRAALAARPASHALDEEEMDFAQALVTDRMIPNPQEARRIAAEGSVGAALDMAINLEKDSVLFYSEILQAVDPQDATAIREIVQQEKLHAQELMIARRNLH